MNEIKLSPNLLSGPQDSSCIKTYVLDDQDNDLLLLEQEEIDKLVNQFLDEDTLTNAKPTKNLEFKVNNDIFITASKDDMIDISRTLALAISSGHAEYTISDGRKIIVKIK